ncbi:MAG: response regulator receiver protein, partial [Desulfuromonadaceae bacterium]|nr:response regulator receiver protein [Desulfuromonadaceae bacterium]
ELIPLFRQCSKDVKIILLADTDNVSFLRQTRAAGIFYHTLQPRSIEDAEELLLALEAACDARAKQHSLWHKMAAAVS